MMLTKDIMVSKKATIEDYFTKNETDSIYKVFSSFYTELLLRTKDIKIVDQIINDLDCQFGNNAYEDDSNEFYDEILDALEKA